MAEESSYTNEPWTEFDLKDLKKHYITDSKKNHPDGKLIKIIANKLRRNEEDVAIKLKECLPTWEILNPPKTIVVSQHSNGEKTGIGHIIDETSVLKTDNKNLQAMNDLLNKEIQTKTLEYQKKIQELSNHKLTLDPTKQYLRCPHCLYLWEIQRVIE